MSLRLSVRSHSTLAFTMVAVLPATASTRTTRILLFLYAGLLSLHVAAAAAAAAASPPPSFSFDFSNTSGYRLQDLRFEGDAALNGDLVDLTCNSKEQKENFFCKGRMSYNHPVPLYDGNTGEVASFATSFTFVINLINGAMKGDGMSFFLSSYPSSLPPGSAGSVLGLINSSGTTATGADRFVAVEFDTYGNPWDPTGSYDHLGIDISSVTSVSTTRLLSYSLNGTMTASITFDNSTRILEASLHFDSNHSLGTAQVKTQLPDRLDALLPPEVAVGFSAATGGNFELHQILSWSFNSTMPRQETQGANFQPKQGQALGDKGHSVDARVIIGGSVLLIPVVWFILSCFMWKRKRISFVHRAGLGEFRRFKYRDLVEATRSFSVENKLGEGTFGVVHRGVLKKYNGEPEEVAVKKIKEPDMGETKVFLDELKASSKASHKNLVELKGWCCNWTKWTLLDIMCWCRQQQQQDVDLFLVYELVPNGTLHGHLYEDMPGQAVLPWATRYKIAKGLGSGLCYLHHDCDPFILHRDIKPCNILLDAEFNPKLADFGLSRIGNHKNIILTRAIGSEGYIDPLCRKDGQVGFKRTADVYSFGVVLLDIACPQKTPDQVRQMYRQSDRDKFFEDVADARLRGDFDRTQMKQVVVLGLWCCFPDDAQRPSMQEAMKVLENDTPLLKRGVWILENGTGLPDEQQVMEKEARSGS